MTSASSGNTTRPTPYVPRERKYVTLALDEVQRIRDELMHMRDAHPRVRVLFSQVAGLYQSLAAGTYQVPISSPNQGNP